jgi:nucleotide-binding universal stress UspA family protein
MERMKTLLVPMDLSDATGPLVGQAGALAALLEAKLILLHVVEPVSSYVPVGASMDVLATAPVTQQPDPAEITKRLEKIAADLKGRAAGVEVRTLVGLAVDEILAVAGAENVDYIVMASHGHGALYHLFSGSVVTGVLKRAKCPVVVVPSALAGRPAES